MVPLPPPPVPPKKMPPEGKTCGALWNHFQGRHSASGHLTCYNTYNLGSILSVCHLQVRCSGSPSLCGKKGGLHSLDQVIFKWFWSLPAGNVCSIPNSLFLKSLLALGHHSLIPSEAGKIGQVSFVLVFEKLTRSNTIEALCSTGQGKRISTRQGGGRTAPLWSGKQGTSPAWKCLTTP